MAGPWSNSPDAILDVGHGGAVALRHVLAVGNPESAPVKRAVRRARAEGRLIDLTYGRPARAVLFLDSGHVACISLSTEAVLARWPAHPSEEHP
jgi:regulator of extracellular matrix RemA (YlzA/DUF370 family)